MRNHQNNSHTIIIWKSFLIVGILQTIPYPLTLFYLPKPSWIILMLIYWITKIPKRINIGSGFTIGLIIDILSGPILGIRAIILSIITYLLLIKLQIFCNMSIRKQGLLVTLFSFNTHLIIYLSHYFTLVENIAVHSEIFLNYLLLNSVTDGIIWIGIILIMCKINSNKPIRIN